MGDWKRDPWLRTQHGDRSVVTLLTEHTQYGDYANEYTTGIVADGELVSKPRTATNHESALAQHYVLMGRMVSDVAERGAI